MAWFPLPSDDAAKFPFLISWVFEAKLKCFEGPEYTFELGIRVIMTIGFTFVYKQRHRSTVYVLDPTESIF